jgi:hypothetical protein
MSRPPLKGTKQLPCWQVRHEAMSAGTLPARVQQLVGCTAGAWFRTAGQSGLVACVIALCYCCHVCWMTMVAVTGTNCTTLSDTYWADVECPFGGPRHPKYVVSCKHCPVIGIPVCSLDQGLLGRSFCNALQDWRLCGGTRHVCHFVQRV